MSHYDDETLGAYIDGELDGDTADALEADLTTDPILRRRVTELRAVGTTLREWCAAQVSPREAAWTSAAIVASEDSRRLRIGRIRRLGRGVAPLWSHALAAGVALLLGIGISHYMNIPARPSDGNTDAAAQRLLQAALEHTLSGQAISWTDKVTRHSVTVQPLGTYRTGGTFCREYRETAVIGTQPDERTMYGLACRSAEGTWSVEYTLAPGARSLLASQ
jgi:surface antigen